jgi:hypothetical protein
LDDVENRDVARRLARHGRHHPIFGLEETTHHVQHCRAPDRLGLVAQKKKKKGQTPTLVGRILPIYLFTLSIESEVNGV